MYMTPLRAGMLALALIASFHPPAPARGEIIDGVAAIVNDDVITISEVDDAGAPIYREIQRKYGDDAQAEISQARREVLDQLVDQKLMEQVIKKYEITASDTEVDLAIDDVKKQNGISQEALERALAKEGITFQDYRDQVRRQIERTKLVSRQVRNRSNVTEAQARKYYDEHPDDFKRDEEIKLRHILIAYPPDATPEQKAAARKKAEGALASLKQGAPFGPLARKVSAGPTAADGGELGWVRRGDTVPEFEAAAFLLDKGRTSEVVETRVGYHVIQVEDKRPARKLTYEESKEAIRSKLSQDLIETEFGEWMKKLRDNAYVEKKL
jgi:peptidyl-prolyl cis-trans isomerase SurA